MRIVDRNDGQGWVVVALWHGAERVVFRGSVYECYRWVVSAG